MSVIDEIAAERQRQIEVEGWTAAHDDKWVDWQLAKAAICYALPNQKERHVVPFHWPWQPEWWKPKDRRQDLIRAAALLVAEIERLDRESALFDPWGTARAPRKYDPSKAIVLPTPE